MGIKIKNLELCFFHFLILPFRYKYRKSIRKMHYYNFQGKIPIVCLRERILLGGSHISHPPKEMWELHKSNQNIKILLQTVRYVSWYTLRQEASQRFLVMSRSCVHSRLLWSRCRKKKRCTWLKRQDQEGGRKEYFVYAQKKNKN